MITTCRCRSGRGTKVGRVIHVVTNRKMLGSGRAMRTSMDVRGERIGVRDIG